MALLAILCDIQSTIWMLLTLQDVCHLRQTCTALEAVISNDKQLWVHIFHRDVKARALRTPTHLKDLEDVDVRAIESWVKHAVLLDRAYKAPDRPLSTRKIDVRRHLGVTWVKLILDRWCLIAAADLAESEVSLWDVDSDGESRCEAKIFLDGPVTDGLVDDSTGEMRCAITVGTRKPYILVLGLFQSTASPVIREIGLLPDASQIRYFKGNMVGFATHNGDDAYSYLANWRTGKLYCLLTPNDTLSPFPTETCMAMTLQNELAFTLHHTAIHIFSTPNVISDGNPTPPRHQASLALVKAAINGQFFKIDLPNPHKEDETTRIHVLYQDRFSNLHHAVVMLIPTSQRTRTFSMEQLPMKQPPNVSGVRCLHFYQLGTSGRTIFCATSLTQRYRWNPSLLISSLNLSNGESTASPSQASNVYTPISRKALPLLHLLSCVDFDDEYGMLLLGTLSGGVRLASILSENVIARESTRCRLSSDVDLNPGWKKVSGQVPVALDLPIFYKIRAQYGPDDQVPEEKVAQVVLDWSDPRVNVHDLPDWSDDWTRYEHIWDWMPPFSRWGPLDDFFVDPTASALIRERLQAFGEITLVIYLKGNHCAVIFRIARRMFYSRIMGEDEDDVDAFEGHEEGILGILPITYDQFLDDPTSILPSLSNWSILTNLNSRKSSMGLSSRSTMAYSYNIIRQHWERTSGTPISISEMEAWTNSDWDSHFHAATNTTHQPYEEPKPLL